MDNMHTFINSRGMKKKDKGSEFRAELSQKKMLSLDRILTASGLTENKKAGECLQVYADDSNTITQQYQQHNRPVEKHQPRSHFTTCFIIPAQSFLPLDQTACPC